MKNAYLARQSVTRVWLTVCLVVGPIATPASSAHAVENQRSLGLALEMLEAGQYDQARSICQAFARQTVTSKESADEVIAALQCLGTIEVRRGDRAAAEAFLKREVELHLRWKHESRSTLYALIRHARLLEKLNRAQKSAAAWRQALDYGEINGVPDETLVDVLQHLALHERDAGNNAEALRLIERSIKANRVFMGLDSTAAFLPQWIWSFLLEQGKDFEVDTLHQAAIEYYEGAGDSPTTDKCRLVEVLGHYYEFLKVRERSKEAGLIQRRIESVKKELGAACERCKPSAEPVPVGH